MYEEGKSTVHITVDFYLLSRAIRQHYGNYMIKLVFLVCWLFVGFGTQLFAQPQRFLVVNKYNGNNRTAYYPGDLITFGLRDEEGESSGIISDVFPGNMILGHDTIAFERVSHVYKRPEDMSAYKSIGIKLITAGLLLFIGDQVNEVVFYGREFSYNQGIAIASGALAATGLVLTQLDRKKMNMAKPGKYRGYRMYVVDIAP